MNKQGVELASSRAVGEVPSQPTCSGQCHGCAYKQGAAANREGDNYLRGVFAALGGYPFICHESLGWRGKGKGYPGGAGNALAVLHSRKVLIAAGADPELIEKQVAEIRRGMRVCGGWKASVARLKAAGWFRRADVTLYRRWMAKQSAGALERLKVDSPERDGHEIQDIEGGIRWFFDEAKDAGIKIGWLFGFRGERHERCGKNV